MAKIDDLTKDLVDLLEEILLDVPKSVNGNKSASQRIRTKTVRLSKLTKAWRRVSLETEQKRVRKK
ncbi:MAG: hypothetical protein A3F09_05465 [Chlamydiae bacterium RIFCSPHIGHO2_12_FULL_49_11]|nr:MAG: hypothetical protein A3F09_05465 [Chlamydiae bacterium RIFCSPHIGHO2_12_FULL_49_11]